MGNHPIKITEEGRVVNWWLEGLLGYENWKKKKVSFLRLPSYQMRGSIWFIDCINHNQATAIWWAYPNDHYYIFNTLPKRVR